MVHYLGSICIAWTAPRYDFTMDLAREGPARFLKSYKGYLEADAYSGYDGIYLGSGDRSKRWHAGFIAEGIVIKLRRSTLRAATG